MKFTQYSGHLLLDQDLLNRLKKESYSLISFSDSNRFQDDVCIFASPNLSAKYQYLDMILQAVTSDSFMIELIPGGCYILLVSHFDRSKWDGNIIEKGMKSIKLVLPSSSLSIFPAYAFDTYFLEGLFMGNKFDKTTWFLSAKMESLFNKIRNNIQSLAYKLLESSKSIPTSKEFRSTFYIFHDIFLFTFDFVTEIPEFLRNEPLKEGIVDGMVDICSNWIYFSLKALESKRDSMCRLVHILGKITDKIAIFFENDGLNHQQFEKFRCSIAAALKELVQRQMFSELDPLDKIRKGGIPNEIYRRTECFQPGRETRLIQKISYLESKLDLMHGSGIVIDSPEYISLEKKLTQIAANLPLPSFKWRKVASFKLIYRESFYIRPP